MTFTKPTKLIGAFFMAFLISPIPNVAFAEGLVRNSTQMISTSIVLADVSRADAENEVRDYLKDSQVQATLIKQGVSPDEVSARLASLSEQEIRQLSGQVKEVRAGGDILVAILLVVLIIFLIKRI